MTERFLNRVRIFNLAGAAMSAGLLFWTVRGPEFNFPVRSDPIIASQCKDNDLTGNYQLTLKVSSFHPKIHNQDLTITVFDNERGIKMKRAFTANSAEEQEWYVSEMAGSIYGLNAGEVVEVRSGQFFDTNRAPVLAKYRVKGWECQHPWLRALTNAQVLTSF